MRIGSRALAVAAAAGLVTAALALIAAPATAVAPTARTAHGASSPLLTVECTYTVNRAGGLPMHTAASSSSPVSYTVPNHANVTAHQDIVNGYRYSHYSSHSGYLSAKYLINQRGCFE